MIYLVAFDVLGAPRTLKARDCGMMQRHANTRREEEAIKFMLVLLLLFF